MTYSRGQFCTQREHETRVTSLVGVWPVVSIVLVTQISDSNATVIRREYRCVRVRVHEHSISPHTNASFAFLVCASPNFSDNLY